LAIVGPGKGQQGQEDGGRGVKTWSRKGNPTIPFKGQQAAQEEFQGIGGVSVNFYVIASPREEA